MQSVYKWKVVLSFAIGLIAIAAIVIFLSIKTVAGAYGESATIGKHVGSFQELSDRFKVLADVKGAPYAYEILRRADLPSNTDLHLLGHTVGDELYKQQGVAGIASCSQDFRNACSHSIVIGALNEYGGEEALKLVRDACLKAPGGNGAYTMCYHGLGHGVFAFYGYDLAKTVAFCKKTGTKEHHMQEYEECVGGAIMELGSGGGHDREAWLAARGKYFKSSNPLAPCSSSIMPSDVKDICYIYITPHLFEAAGGTLANPQPADFKKSFEFCDAIPSSQMAERTACFLGIGKELPVLALERDVRDLNDATDVQLDRMREWCRLAPNDEAYKACSGSILDSLFWGGENNPDVSVRYCSQAAEKTEVDGCFWRMFDQARIYVPTLTAKEHLCTVVPSEQVAKCREMLSL